MSRKYEIATGEYPSNNRSVLYVLTVCCRSHGPTPSYWSLLYPVSVTLSFHQVNLGGEQHFRLLLLNEAWNVSVHALRAPDTNPGLEGQNKGQLGPATLISRGKMVHKVGIAAGKAPQTGIPLPTQSMSILA